MKKNDLINFAKFLFRSGEESFRLKNNIELDAEIEKYIRDTFMNYLECLRNKYKDEPKFEQTTEIINSDNKEHEEIQRRIREDGASIPELSGGVTSLWLKDGYRR